MLVKILINNILNIKPDEKQRWLLLASVFTGLLLSYVCPIMSKTIFTDLPPQWFAIQEIIICLSGLLVGMVWRGKFRDFVVRYFVLLCALESVAGFVLGIYLAFINYNSWLFAVASLIYNSMVTLVILKAIMVFKTTLWNEEKREVYDNNNDIVANIVCLGGCLISLIHMPSIGTACFLWGLCCLVDNLGWIYVYFKYLRKATPTP